MDSSIIEQIKNSTPNKTKVELWYCDNILDAMFKDPSDLKYHHATDIMFWYRPEDLDRFCDDIFRKYNFVDEPFPDFKGRSMSVGDVIIIDGEQAMFCASMGWRDLSHRLIPGANNTIAFKKEE